MKNKNRQEIYFRFITEGSVKLCSDGKFNPEANLDAELKVSAVKYESDVHVGSEDLNAEVDVGVIFGVKIEAKVQADLGVGASAEFSTAPEELVMKIICLQEVQIC